MNIIIEEGICMNPYIWKLYLEAGGRETVAFFQQQFTHGINEEYTEKIKEFLQAYCACSELIDESIYNIQDAITDINNDLDFMRENESSEKQERFISNQLTAIWDQYCEEFGNPKEAFLNISASISYISTIIAYDYPEIFIPYYFRCNYNVLEIIAESFSINLPVIPSKKDYEKRFYYYGDICKALHEYRLINNWSPYELLAFLYDFAPKYIGGIDSYIIKDLPEPKSAFFVGGGGNNADREAENDKDMISFWQCNPDTRAGDMIVMYLTTPISSISSIWRSCSIGFNDPFFFYYRCTYICNPIKGKRIGLREIKTDKVLGQMPIVAKNMQGINGVELKPSEYNHILDITKSTALRIEYSADIQENEYSSEKEVEDNIIKPFLRKMGYTEDDYTQQLRIDVGNHNSLLIPDFVLLPNQIGRNKTAFAVIEAKRSITNIKDRDAALGQARSYAKQLGARYSAVVSQEKLWITSIESDYSELLQEWAWSELGNLDNFMLVRHVLEKR